MRPVKSRLGHPRPDSGCQRRVYWVPADGSKKFLRLRATSP